jgi:AraC-like DNA-binding protein
MPAPPRVEFVLGGRRRFGRTTFVTWEPELHAPVARYTLRGFHNFYYNVTGKRRIRVGGRWYPIGEDCLFIALDGEECEAARMEEVCRSFTVHVSSLPGDRVVAACARSGPCRKAEAESGESICCVPRLVNTPGVRFRILFEELVTLANSPALPDRQLALLRLDEALLLAQRGSHGLSEAAAPAGADGLLSLVREDMLFFPGRDHRASSVAARLGVSEATLRRRFRSATGKTLKRFHTELKVRMAMELLEANRRLSLKELAEHLGFYDQFHLSKTFKAVTGSSPREYRAREHHGAAVLPTEATEG